MIKALKSDDLAKYVGVDGSAAFIHELLGSAQVHNYARCCVPDLLAQPAGPRPIATKGAQNNWKR